MRKLIGLALVVTLVGSTGCRGPRNNYADLQAEAAEHMTEGKQALAQQRYFDALSEFNTILEEIDSNNSEARMGKVLAELLQFASIVRVVDQVFGFTSAADENDFIVALIRDLVGDLTRRFESIAFDLRRLKTDPYFQLVLESTPVYLTASDDPTLNLQGEWDRSEVFLLDAPVQAALGALKFADSIDLRGDFLGVYNKFVDLDIDLGGAPSIELNGDEDDESLEETIYNAIESVEFSFHKIQNLLAWTLNKNPNLLGVRPDVGLGLSQEAGDHFVNAIDSFQRALFFVSLDAQSDIDQSDDVISWGSNKVYASEDDVPEVIDPDLDTCVVRDKSGYDEDDDPAAYEFTFQVFPDGPESFTTGARTSCLIDKLKRSLDNDGTRINLITDILPVVESLLESAVGTIAATVARDIVIDFVGNSIELDFGPLFQRPNGLRKMLPGYDTSSQDTDSENWLLWMELECKYDTSDRYEDIRNNYANGSTVTGQSAADGYYETRVINRILCLDNKDAARNFTTAATAYCDDPDKDGGCDTSHFTPTELSDTTVPAASHFTIGRFQQDGIAGVLPYVGMQDPSFNGLLWVDVNNIGSDENKLKEIDESPNFALATNATFNGLLAFVGSNFDTILDLVGTID